MRADRPQPRVEAETPAEKGPDFQFYLWFGISAVVMLLGNARSYLRMNGERFEVLKLLTSSVMPLGILTVIVLVVITRCRRLPDRRSAH